MSLLDLISALPKPLLYVAVVGCLTIMSGLMLFVGVGVRRGTIQAIDTWPPRIRFNRTHGAVALAGAGNTHEGGSEPGTVQKSAAPPAEPKPGQSAGRLTPIYPRPQPPQRVNVPPDGFASLIFHSGAERGAMYVLCPRHTSISVGRSSHCDIVIRDEGASRCHFRLVISQTGTHEQGPANSVRLVDAGTVNGTHVNGQKVQSTELNDGDIIEVGDTRMRYKALRK